jgi:hypothetical protein
MAFEFVAFIDEAGDDGTDRIRSIDGVGASEWFVMAAVVVRQKNIEKITQGVRDLKQSLGIKPSEMIHFKKLAYDKKLIAATMVAEFPIRIFVVTSNKKNMR